MEGSERAKDEKRKGEKERERKEEEKQSDSFAPSHPGIVAKCCNLEF